MSSNWIIPSTDKFYSIIFLPYKMFSNVDIVLPTIKLHFQVQHLNWMNQFKAVRSAIGIKWPGYMIHESGAWSHIHEKWFFLPRRCSNEPYNETKDEVMGCNYLITADANFKNVAARQVGLKKKVNLFTISSHR